VRSIPSKYNNIFYVKLELFFRSGFTYFLFCIVFKLLWNWHWFTAISKMTLHFKCPLNDHISRDHFPYTIENDVFEFHRSESELHTNKCACVYVCMFYCGNLYKPPSRITRSFYWIFYSNHATSSILIPILFDEQFIFVRDLSWLQLHLHKFFSLTYFTFISFINFLHKNKQKTLPDDLNI
jgi:hypothetical protein